MRSSTFLLSCIFALAQAYTKPLDTPTWGALRLPDLEHPLIKGEDFKITWDPTGHPTDGVKVSLVLCRGNSNTCALDPSAIVEAIPALPAEYVWHVPCDLPAGQQKTDSGYGMLVIVEGTGEFQYSTQFSVLDNPDPAKCPVA